MSEPRGSGDDRFTEQLAAYAVGALDPDELAALEAHLADCAHCRAELDRLLVAASALALSAGDAAEPPGHFARFAARLDALPPEPAPAVEPPGHQARFLQKLEAESDAAPAARPAPAAPPPARSPLTAAPPARPWWARLGPRTGWALAGTLAVLVVLAGVWGLAAQQRAADAEQRAAAAAAQLATVTVQRDALAAALADPATRSIALTGSGGLQAAQVQLLADPQTGRAVLAANALPPPPAGKVYELWLIKGQTPVAVDVFTPDAQGRGLLVFAVPGNLGNYDVAAITVEARQSGPADQPAGPGGAVLRRRG